MGKANGWAKIFRKAWPPPNLLKQCMRGVESGVFQAPRAFDVLYRYRSEELKTRYPFPTQYFFPEAPLIEQFYARYPEAKSEPVKLNSFVPPLAKRVALRQLALMEQGMTESDARERADGEYEEQIKGLLQSQQTTTAFIRLVQQDEEQQLDQALKELAVSRGIVTRE